MNTRTYPAVLGLAVASLSAALVAGCNRTGEVAQTDRSPPAVRSVESGTPPAVQRVENSVTDTLVTTKVKTALLKNQDTKGLDVHVETHEGVVQLTGTVESQAQSDTAVVVARAVDGVKSVENNITAKGGKLTVGQAG